MAVNNNKKSSGDYWVYSTLSSDQMYTQWAQSKDGSPNTVQSEVLIAGKANLADKHMITPKGVVTKITAEQHDMLSKNDAFVRHKEAGYLLVEQIEANPDKVAKDMKPKDGSAPLVASDFEEGKAPKANKVQSAGS